MRFDLRVPFHDRHEARAAGARWDAGNGVWWADSDHLELCQRWVPGRVVGTPRPDQEQSQKRGPIKDYERLACGCMRVYPWLLCKHGN